MPGKPVDSPGEDVEELAVPTLASETSSPAGRMTASAFLAARGLTCVRCGMPATVRFGVDLVEPDSGVASCGRCAEAVRIGTSLLTLGAEDDAELAGGFLRPTRKWAKAYRAEREALARELGWDG